MTRPDAIEAIVLATSTNETKARGRVRKVTFEIPADGPNPFEGMGGERIHIVCVRINNDETPAPPKQLGATERNRWENLPPAQQAAIRCGEAQFRDFLKHTVCDEKGWDAPATAEEAAEVVRWACDVQSRKDLNTNAAAGAVWRKMDSQFWLWSRGYQQ